MNPFRRNTLLLLHAHIICLTFAAQSTDSNFNKQHDDDNHNLLSIRRAVRELDQLSSNGAHNTAVNPSAVVSVENDEDWSGHAADLLLSTLLITNKDQTVFYASNKALEDAHGKMGTSRSNGENTAPMETRLVLKARKRRHGQPHRAMRFKRVAGWHTGTEPTPNTMASSQARGNQVTVQNEIGPATSSTPATTVPAGEAVPQATGISPKSNSNTVEGENSADITLLESANNATGGGNTGSNAAGGSSGNSAGSSSAVIITVNTGGNNSNSNTLGGSEGGSAGGNSSGQTFSNGGGGGGSSDSNQQNGETQGPQVGAIFQETDQEVVLVVVLAAAIILFILASGCAILAIKERNKKNRDQREAAKKLMN